MLKNITSILISASIFFIQSNSASAIYFNKISFLCHDNKGINASFIEGPYFAATSTNNAIRSSRVSLTLNNGRQLILQKSHAQDEVSYKNEDDNISFVIRGNGAFLKENGKKTYSGCIRLAENAEKLPQNYVTDFLSNGFSIRYPKGYGLNSDYEDDGSKSGKKGLSGIKISVYESMIDGTNLLVDSGVSVEQIPNSSSCKASMFFKGNENANGSEADVEDFGVLYSVDSRKDRRMNITYEEKIWAIKNTNPCTAIRYFFYYKNPDMLDPDDRIRQFDRAALNQTFDDIRHSVVVNQQ